MFPSLMRLIRNWLYSDQIRISPSSGRLLELYDGARIWLLDRIWIVTQIETHLDVSPAHAIQRVYSLRQQGHELPHDLEACARLVVTAVNDSKMRVRGQLIWGKKELEVLSDEIVILAKTSDRECMSS